MHHDAHTFNSQTLPRISSAETRLEGTLSCANWNDGAGLLISGDGTSCGSCLRPMARNTTSAMKRTSGITNLVILLSLPWPPQESVVDSFAPALRAASERRAHNGDH